MLWAEHSIAVTAIAICSISNRLRCMECLLCCQRRQMIFGVDRQAEDLEIQKRSIRKDSAQTCPVKLLLQIAQEEQVRAIRRPGRLAEPVECVAAIGIFDVIAFARDDDMQWT